MEPGGIYQKELRYVICSTIQSGTHPVMTSDLRINLYVYILHTAGHVPVGNPGSPSEAVTPRGSERCRHAHTHACLAGASIL